MQGVRIAAAQDVSLNSLCKRPKLEITMDLHLLAQTAHALETCGGTNTKGPSPAGHHPQQQQPSISGTTSHAQAGVSDLAGLSAEGFRMPSMARSSDSGLGPNKQHKHRAAEQRRRERINERLAQLRELVPHDTRSNTATFLEGVIAYVQSLQQSNIAMEAELAALRRRQQQQQLPGNANATAAALAAQGEQHPDSVAVAAGLAAAVQIAQPCLSGVSAAAAAAANGGTTPLSSSPPCEGPEAQMPAAAALVPAAVASSYSTGAQQPSFSAGALQAFSNCNIFSIEAGQPALSGATALSMGRVSGSSPSTAAGTPSPTAAAAAAAASASAAVAAVPSAFAAAAAAAAAAAPNAPPGMHIQLQPAELQSVLEKALLNALQHQARQLATQLNKQ